MDAEKTSDEAVASTALFGIGDVGFWADADKRAPGHLRILKIIIIGIEERMYRVRWGVFEYLVPSDSVFRTVNVRDLEEPNVPVHPHPAQTQTTEQSQ